MKRLPLLALLAVVLLSVVYSCKKDENATLWDTYAEWRDDNSRWLTEMQYRTNEDGTPYYKTIVPSWNPAAYVLIHYFNDPEENADKLSPLATSTIDTRYILHYYDDTPVDSSYNLTTNGKGIFRTTLNNVIEGWTIAFETMHVGDTAEIIVPYASGYGSTSTSGILPYSNLRFNVRLVDIPYYEKNPN